MANGKASWRAWMERTGQDPDAYIASLKQRADNVASGGSDQAGLDDILSEIERVGAGTYRPSATRGSTGESPSGGGNTSHSDSSRSSTTGSSGGGSNLHTGTPGHEQGGWAATDYSGNGEIDVGGDIPYHDAHLVQGQDLVTKVGDGVKAVGGAIANVWGTGNKIIDTALKFFPYILGLIGLSFLAKIFKVRIS